MVEAQFKKEIENLILMPLIILIGLYLTASAIFPFLNLKNQTYNLIFTLLMGVPSLIFFFKKNIEKPNPKLKE